MNAPVLAMDRAVWWYASRSSGLVLWALLAASLLWGFAVSTRLVRKRGIPAWMLDLHRHLGTLALAFMVVHVTAIWADSYVEFDAAALFLPMSSTWRPGAVAYGIVALYLVALVQVTSWTMRRLPRRVWHAVHLLSLPAFVLASVHGILAGADWSNRYVQWAALIVSTAVVWLATFRALGGGKSAPGTSDRLAAARAAAAQARRGEARPTSVAAEWGPPGADSAARAELPAPSPR